MYIITDERVTWVKITTIRAVGLFIKIIAILIKQLIVMIISMQKVV